MASAALLEYLLFFDALGMFVRDAHPRVARERRTGKELWDYGVKGLQLSHKNGLSTTISMWWACDRPVRRLADLVRPLRRSAAANLYAKQREQYGTLFATRRR